MGNATKAWDDSGTARGVGSDPTLGEPPLFILDEAVDNVGIAMRPLAKGDVVSYGGETLDVLTPVPPRHKIALVDIDTGETVRKLGHAIGIATNRIAAGEHVHVHNLAVPPKTRAAAPATTKVRPPWHSGVEVELTSFLGFRRRDGRVGTRNYIGILPSVNCAATVGRLAATVAAPRLAGVPSCDGVIALVHDLGCGMAQGTTEDDLLRRTLRGYATHPNLAAVIVVTLGCEVNQPENFLDGSAAHVEHLSIQELGGTNATVAAIVERVGAIAASLEQLEREPVPLSELTLGLQCGGSDAASAISANPTLGVASDLLVAAGGRVILGETPEIFGAEQLLRQRAVTPELADRIDQKIAWWLDYAARNGVELDNNPSAGNREGGITTIWEKSLGAVLKGGTAPLSDVVDYAEPVVRPGLTFMDTPGYDPVSATGMVAGGANVLAFTTGRGSVYGSRPVPCLKISSTTQLYERMPHDIDFDAGGATTRTAQVERGAQLFAAIVEMASGKLSTSELLGFGAEEIAPWRLGAVL
ncbi:MAG TPA: altronate dehydratase family protein [Gaiellaceae bacterium]|nr:altronate dehydratase family protein [Gaiellaceae bacterium]